MEGDIAVPTSDSDITQVKDSFVKDKNQLWDGGVIPYRFAELELVGGVWEPLFSLTDTKTIKQALEHIMENVPCLQFR